MAKKGKVDSFTSGALAAAKSRLSALYDRSSREGTDTPTTAARQAEADHQATVNRMKQDAEVAQSNYRPPR